MDSTNCDVAHRVTRFLLARLKNLWLHCLETTSTVLRQSYRRQTTASYTNGSAFFLSKPILKIGISVPTGIYAIRRRSYLSSTNGKGYITFTRSQELSSRGLLSTPTCRA